MADQINKNIGRRKFFSRTGKTAIVTALMSSFPFKIFANERRFDKVKIKINPLAVKRNK